MPDKQAARLFAAILAGAALGGLVTLASRPPVDLPALPDPPTIAARRGPLPSGVVAFKVHLRAASGDAAIGCGFVLQLPNSDVIGVAAAHSLGDRAFASITFTAADNSQAAARFSQLYAPAGRARTGTDMTVDYLLMRPDADPSADIVLQPDARGGPQPGERVLIISGLGDGRGAAPRFAGTVESVDQNGAWIRMDEVFDPRGMSGSPVVSQHTGRVVGMLIVMNLVPGALRLGINPVGAIVAAAAP